MTRLGFAQYGAAVWLALLLLVLPMSSLVSRVGTPEDRIELFEYIVQKTLERTAWSPYPIGNPQVNFAKQAQSLRAEFVQADTDQKLFHALIKLSNLRRDRHLLVHTVREGLEPPEFLLEAGLRFQADVSRSERPLLFVANFDRAIQTQAGRQPEIGDILVAVNDIPVEKYVQMLEPYLRYASVVTLWWEAARAISTKDWQFGPELYRDTASFTLATSSGKTYSLELPYLEPQKIEWAGYSQELYSGFKQALDTQSYTLYLPTHQRKVLLIKWKGFYPSAPADIEQLMRLAREKSLLGHDLIVDATSSRGGSRGAYIMAHLFSRPFYVTQGNLRLSDITPAFVRYVHKVIQRGGNVGGSNDGGRRLLEWLDTDVMQAYRANQSYSPDVPFKLADLPKDATQMYPATVHFTGRVVCWFSPINGSHLDQFAAMVVDNQLAHTIGMPTAGYSNTWEWREVLRFARTAKPVAEFMWSIGNTLRPNGQILGGNPAAVDDFFPPTRENFTRYHSLLLDRTYAWLDRHPNQ